jgi:hypothetical protein
MVAAATLASEDKAGTARTKAGRMRNLRQTEYEHCHKTDPEDRQTQPTDRDHAEESFGKSALSVSHDHACRHAAWNGYSHCSKSQFYGIR